MFDAKTVLKSIPDLPGVYRMINSADEVIYVGKALNLKKRVSSYFQKNIPSPRTRMMVSQIARIETTVTGSEAEALLLENNLIKSLMPRYNVVFRDDKSYPYIMLSGDRFPRLAFHRGSQQKPHQYYGPFPSALAVRESIQLLQKVFKLRTCENTVFSNRSRPCLQHQIDRCTAPCVDFISEDDYKRDVSHAAMFLEGKEQQVLDDLSEKMMEAAEQQEYELAAVYRDRIQSLRQVQQRQFVTDFRSGDADVVACVIEHGAVCVNLVMIRGGRHLGDRSFFPKNAEGCDEASALMAFLEQHYLDRPVPPLIITGVALEDSEVLEALLTEQTRRKVQISAYAGGDRRVWLKMAQTNAEIALRQHLAQKATQETRLEALREALELPESTQRIECFDISHTMGEATVASCVVFDKGAMQNSEYRRYNIEGITPGDDYAAMRDALTRRYKKIAAGEGKVPDVIFIDGGKGQLGIAEQVMMEVGLPGVILLGIAKGEERKPGLEQLFFPDREEPLRVPADNPGLHLLQQIRDEAHRFAITGHRGRRAKARTHSSLEDIDGVGAKRRQKLLVRFGGLAGVRNASIDELAQVEGISETLAQKIYEELH
ncbi:excinuclease ABC subunit C [Novimethylophilus kurashikiensis]|uniref:UvrABC system protein C n=1 Tax=Novimethylophilus kurashikiensis TaxID=1825523 RepID=A0A2R5FJJ1_9PROT|nr:excinuclease ABC subunit UvrC [Novimethylophilus kurashikiensis]GBG15971.1 excinuclease ABC subunit C [Novimethylophilus kurashikiensis]